MEAVPKLPLLSFELKVSTENTHFGPKLKQYIAEAYREDPDSYGNEIHQLEGLRSAAVRPTIDVTGLNSMIRYFCQLRAIQSRFPMGKGQPVACTFAWKDLYANMSCSLADIKFEMACILYNIGALHTQLGSSEPRTTADSLKSACQHYQHAAWAFQFLREQYPQPPGADVSSDILKLLQEICFAQAQECILDKSIQDTRKPSVIGSVATQVMYFYKNSLAHLGPSTGTDNIHEIIGTKLYNNWHRYLSFKLSYIGCIVCLYQGMHAEEQQKMGERVAFYQQAVDKLGEARKLSKYIEPVQVTQEALTFTNDVVEGKRKAAKNENEFIYHEEVPEKDMLSDLKPVCLVSAVAINFNDTEVAGPDIFSRLVPMVAHEASSMYSEEKAKLLRHIGNQVDAKNTELTEFMSSLQLDQLDVLDSDQKIPQEIVDRCAAMNAKGEIIPALVDSMNSLAEIISDVEHSLDEIKTLIQEETIKEKEFQKQMGPRPPSLVQTELAREYHKYREAHARTHESNQVLHKAMTLHIANLRLLAQPLHALQAKIPSIDNIEGLDRATMKEMRYVVDKAREMQRQRDALVQQLRAAAAADDVTPVLLARPHDAPADIFRQELDKHTPTIKIIEQNLAAQENIINKLTSLYAAYGESRRLLADVLRKREGLINALVTSYDTHAELLGKSQKGLEFYRKLAHNVAALAARARAVCQVQREERAAQAATAAAPASAAAPAASAKVLDSVPTPTAGGTLKLKDYLPYMKNRSFGRSQLPQAPAEQTPTESYYPETIYPTSVRPTPVGSEATELTQPMPDGVVMPQGMQMMQNPYSRQYTPYAPPETDPYNPQTSYAFPMTKYSKPEENYSYSSYTPPQYSTQMADPQIYTNPYYSATQNNSTAVTDSQNPTVYSNMDQNTIQNQYGTYNEPYKQGQVDPNAQFNKVNQDITANFAQMNISAKPEQPNIYSGEYAQTHYSVQYPQSFTPTLATYSNAGQNSNTNIVESPLPTGNSMNYPYTSDPMLQYGQANISQGQNMQQPNAPYSVQNSMQNMQSYNQNIPSSMQAGMQNVANSMQHMQNTNQNMPNFMSTNPMQNMQNSSQNISNAMQAGTPAMQNVANPMPNMQNPSQNAPNSMQPGAAVMQNVANPMQMIPNSVQNIHSPIQNVPNPMQNMQSPGQNVGNQFQNNMAYSMPNTSISNMPQSGNFSNPMQNPIPSSIPVSVPNSSAIPTVSGYSTDQQYPYSLAYDSVSQGYVYTSADGLAVTTTTNSQAFAGQSYSVPDPNLSQLDALDKPIKSHAKGEALSSKIPTYQNFNPQTPVLNTQYPDQSSYGQVYQNHPGYTFNATSGNYDYNYGSQNAYTNYGNMESRNDQNWSAQGTYTSAGACETVQSPSETPQMPSDNNATYYNLPYGYLTTTNQANEMPVVTQQYVEPTTNYGANMNNSTYMQSGQIQDSSVTYSSGQVTNARENVAEQNAYPSDTSNSQSNFVTSIAVNQNQSSVSLNQNYQENVISSQSQSNIEQTQNYSSNPAIDQNQINDQKSNETPDESTPKEVPKTEPVTKEDSIEQSTFDLLSDIDFSVVQKPLMPEIKVPQVSEKAIVKTPVPKLESVKQVPKEEVIERPAKRDIFSDPSLLNQFTQEVKNLQKLTDSLTDRTPSGITVLDAKWKTFQDVQAKENVNRSKYIAMQHASGAAEVVPYDDSRLTLKSDPDAYINASYYKQLGSWCIPLVISKCPDEAESAVFWKAVLENDIACIVCLLSEIEMQGKAYWPTAKGQCLELSAGLRVTLCDVTCTVHWTERHITVALGKHAARVVHYQINVYPAKVVCPPLVQLADAVLAAAGAGAGAEAGAGACVQCARGAGRSAAFALLLLALCQVRAGHVPDGRLADMLDTACVDLYRRRTNVLEDTKYLADAYRTVLYYVQGVLCSGTTKFNGEAVSVASGASVLPPAPPALQASSNKSKFSKESFEEMKQAPGLKSGDMKDPLNFLDPLWSLKKK